MKRQISIVFATGLIASLSACSSMPLEKGDTLASYENLKPVDDQQVKAEIWVDKSYVETAKTAKIIPTSLSPKVREIIANANDGALLENAINRSLCNVLSNRFEMVGANQKADLAVHATVVDLRLTDKDAAALSTVATLGASVVSPVPIPRLPIGLGGLAVEAEAKGKDGKQRAAMLWARGANSFTTKARMSDVGDAYALSFNFGGDFARLLVVGGSPYKDKTLNLPSRSELNANLGGNAKYAACDVFGRAPGVAGLLASQVGLAPGVTDKGGEETKTASPAK